jgi:hypothetical protein
MKFVHARLNRLRKSGTKIWNDSKIRISNDFFIEPNNCVLVQKTNYFNGLLSNDLANFVVKDTLLGVFHKIDSLYVYNGKLLPLSVSKCSNHIGVNTLALDEENNIYLQTNSANNAQNGDSDVPTGSGSVDYEDLTEELTLNGLICRSINRELIEEN